MSSFPPDTLNVFRNCVGLWVLFNVTRHFGLGPTALADFFVIVYGFYQYFNYPLKFDQSQRKFETDVNRLFYFLTFRLYAKAQERKQQSEKNAAKNRRRRYKKRAQVQKTELNPVKEIVDAFQHPDAAKFQYDLKTYLEMYAPSKMGAPVLKTSFSLNAPFELMEKTPKRRVSAANQRFLAAEVEKLQNSGIISAIAQPERYCQAIVIKNSQDKFELGVNFAPLNKIMDSYGSSEVKFPKNLEYLSGSVVSKIHLPYAFNSIGLTPESASYTAFEVMGKFYQFNVLPYGLSAGPELFHRLMESVMRLCRYYARLSRNEILVVSLLVEDHKHDLQETLSNLFYYGIKFDAERSEFFRTQVKWADHKIRAVNSQLQVRPTDLILALLANFPRPNNQTSLRQLLGYASRVKNFIPNYSAVIAPLTSLLNGPYLWTVAQQDVFEYLKKIGTNGEYLAVGENGGCELVCKN